MTADLEVRGARGFRKDERRGALDDINRRRDRDDARVCLISSEQAASKMMSGVETVEDILFAVVDAFVVASRF